MIFLFSGFHTKHHLRGASWAGLLVVWLMSAPPTLGQQQVALEGRVRAEGGKVIPMGVTVRLETVQGQTVAEQLANSDGEFSIPGLAHTDYRLVVTAPGFLPYREELDLRRAAFEFFVGVTLLPEEKQKEDTSRLPSLTDMAAPKQARQEHEKGLRALERQDFAEAQKHFEKAIAEYPCYARAQTELALAFAGQNDAVRAEAALRKAIECDPDYQPTYSALGLILNSQRRFAESEKALQEGLRRAPRAWRLHYQIALAYFGQQQFAQAEKAYLKALELNPAPPAEIYARLADVYLAMRDYSQAYAYMQAYLRSIPEGRFADAIRARMAKIEASGVLTKQQADEPPQ